MTAIGANTKGGAYIQSAIKQRLPFPLRLNSEGDQREIPFRTGQIDLTK